VLSLIRTTHLRDIIDTHQRVVVDLSELRSAILPRLQRVERELMVAKLGRFFAELHVAIELTVRQRLEAAQAIEKGGPRDGRSAAAWEGRWRRPRSERVAVFRRYLHARKRKTGSLPG